MARAGCFKYDQPMQSKATTVAAYLASLPADRRAAISAVRDVILKNLDKDYQEGMSYGMIGYSVPHSVFPAGYHCDPRQPLPFAGLASQKNHMSVYLMGMYCGCVGEQETELVRWFRAAWAKTGKKLDMGKACIRFKKLDEVALDVLGEAIKRVPVKKYVAHYTEALEAMGKSVKPPKTATTTGAAKPASARRAKKVSGSRVRAKPAPKRTKVSSK